MKDNFLFGILYHRTLWHNIFITTLVAACLIHSIHKLNFIVQICHLDNEIYDCTRGKLADAVEVKVCHYLVDL